MNNVIDVIEHDIKKGKLIHGKCVYGYLESVYHENDNSEWIYYECHKNKDFIGLLNCNHCKYFKSFKELL